MKAIGIPQPEAWLIINEYLERLPLSASTTYRGPILVYAASDPITPVAFEKFTEECRRLRLTSYPQAENFEFGGFIGTACLNGFEMNASGEAIAILDSPVELGFVSFAGRSGIFDVAEDPFNSVGFATPIISSQSKTSTSKMSNKTPNQPENTLEKTTNNKSGESSLSKSFLDGVEEELRSSMKKNLNKIGRGLAKDALSIGTELVTSLLSGKPTKSRRR